MDALDDCWRTMTDDCRRHCRAVLYPPDNFSRKMNGLAFISEPTFRLSASACRTNLCRVSVSGAGPALAI
ncbi:MAG: hypothetical protein KDJ33_03080, partial [Gammaproteobacteria bacterium]|nr:hypothetical protein [Gammaproteobacteria bacterium]